MQNRGKNGSDGSEREKNVDRTFPSSLRAAHFWRTTVKEQIPVSDGPAKGDIKGHSENIKLFVDLL